VQEFSERLGVGKSSEGFEPLRELKEGKRPRYLEDLKEGVATSDRRRPSSQGKRRTVGILCGESRSPVSRQISRRSRGVTASVPKGSKLRRSRTVDPSPGVIGFTRGIIFWVFASGSPVNFATGIAKSRNVKSRRAKKIVWATRIGRWTGGALSTWSQTQLTISGFRGVKI
jgi:hypothetical protein